MEEEPVTPPDFSSHEEDLGLASLLLDLPEAPPPCPLCAAEGTLSLRYVRRVQAGFRVSYEMLTRVDCTACKKYCERDATQEEQDTCSFEGDLYA